MTKRWLDEGAPEGVRDLLRAAEPPRGMRPAERARGRARLRRVALLPIAAGLGLWMKGGLLAAGLALASTSVVWVVARGGAEGREVVPSLVSAAPRHAATASRSVEARPPPPEEAPTALTPEKPRVLLPSAAPTKAAVSVEATPEPSLAAEAALLERARGALGANAASALALADEHRTRFPKGQLGTERELIAIDALVRLGRRDVASRRAGPLLAQPGLYHDRAARILGEEP